MSTEKEALQYLVETVGPANAAECHDLVEVSGQEYLVTMGTGKIGLPPPEPLAEPLEVVSLASFCEYIKANRDALALDKQQIVVNSPVHVALVSALSGRHRQREAPLVALCPARPFRFGEPLSMVDFIVGVRTRFTPEGDREALLDLVSAVKSSESAEFMDTGAGQDVVAHKGLELKERRRVTEPFLLHPFRAFPEVPQVGSPFILRLSEGRHGEPCAALYECDGGAWEIKARAAVATWITTHLTEDIPILH